MPNIEDYESPEALLKAAVEKVRLANGVKLFELPMEATEAQRQALSDELRARFPWHTVICIGYRSAPGSARPSPPAYEVHSLGKLRSMIEIL